MEKLKAQIILILADIFLVEAHEKDEELLDEGIKALTLCIGRAYADGLALPREVRRGFLERTINEDRVWWANGMDALDKYTRVDFIALRKEEQQSNMPRYCEHCGSEEHYTSEH